MKKYLMYLWITCKKHHCRTGVIKGE